MTREEAIDILKCEKNWEHRAGKKIHEALDMAIEALEQEPCEDAISREWLKIAIHNFYYGLKHTPTEEDIQAYIDAAPSFTPQQKTGHWIVDELFDDEWSYRCSECGETYLFWLDKHETPKDYGYDFCPKCRAKMVEPQESENKKEESEKEKYRLLLAFMSGLISNKEEREKAVDYIKDMISKE